MSSTPTNTNANPTGNGRKIGEWTRDWARTVGRPVIYTDSTGSTNTDARLYDGTFDQLGVIVTDHQSQGRGRGTNTWETPDAGHYLLSSWVRDLHDAPQPIFAARMGLLLYQAMQHAWPAPSLELSLKAPNDLYLGSQKAAGLLIEVISQASRHRVVVGLGINISAVPALPTATSLEIKLGRSIESSEWRNFLDIWSKTLETAVGDLERTTLNYQECEDLRRALNLYPPLKDQVLTVQPNASLHLKNKNVNWHDL